MRKAEVVTDGLGVGEGPVWRSDGAVVLTSVDQGVLWRVTIADGRKTVIARTGGGANTAAPVADGGFLVTQNGGFDFRNLGIDAPAPDLVEPGVQRVRPDGSVSYLLRGGYQAPNDLVVDADGVLWFTDPAPFPFDPAKKAGRIWALDPGALEPRLAARDFGYCNGIGLDHEGRVLAVEDGGLARLEADGTRSWVIEDAGGAIDGFCVDVQGRIYAALPGAHGVRVFENGKAVGFLAAPDADRIAADNPYMVTNACFGGEDGRTLFATTGFPGRLIAWEGLPAAGARVYAWGG